MAEFFNMISDMISREGNKIVMILFGLSVLTIICNILKAAGGRKGGYFKNMGNIRNEAEFSNQCYQQMINDLHQQINNNLHQQSINNLHQRLHDNLRHHTEEAMKMSTGIEFGGYNCDPGLNPGMQMQNNFMNTGMF